MKKRIITVADVVRVAENGEKYLPAPQGECIVTPGAVDKAEELGISFNPGQSGDSGSVPQEAPAESSRTHEVIGQVCAIMKDRIPKGVEASKLEELVREIVVARLSGPGAPMKCHDTGTMCNIGGVCFIDGERLLKQGASPIPVDEKVLVADAINCGEGTRLAGGYMEWERASFSRTVDYPEVGIVIEGELKIEVNGETLRGKPGDMLYFPKGTEVVYSTPSRVRLACVNCIA